MIVLFVSCTSSIFHILSPNWNTLTSFNATMHNYASSGPTRCSTRQSSIIEEDKGKRSRTDTQILRYLLMLPIRHREKCHHRITSWFYSQPAVSRIWRIIERVSPLFILREMWNLSVLVYLYIMLWVLLSLTANLCCFDCIYSSAALKSGVSSSEER